MLLFWKPQTMLKHCQRRSMWEVSWQFFLELFELYFHYLDVSLPTNLGLLVPRYCASFSFYFILLIKKLWLIYTLEFRHMLNADLCYLLSAILGAVSGSRPRADVVYCIDALARRLAKTRTWAVCFLVPFLFSVIYSHFWIITAWHL